MTNQEVTKVQELIYTSKVETVMEPDVLVLSPDMSVAEAKSFMQDRRISGAPVLEDDQIIGILSVTDVIATMERRELDTLVVQNMIREVKTISKDASVMEAISYLDRRGYSRLPVVDREGRLVGIVTKGTVVRGLLHQLDASIRKKEAEKLQTYRASHIFEDITSDDTSLVLRFAVDDKDFENAGKASSMIKRSLQRLGAGTKIVRRVAVAAYEAEMNLIIHTDVGGEIVAEIRKDRMTISAEDHGPGIANIEQVLQPGYSTAPEWVRDMGFGAGMGLANIKRCADMMKLMSQPGCGTKLEIVFLFTSNTSAAEEET